MHPRRRSAGEGHAGAAASKPSARTLKTRAIALLSRRDYSRAELRRKLVGRRAAVADEFEAGEVAAHEDVEALLDELAQLGYLSDERYAHALAARRSGTHSRRAIAEELKARGVAADVVQSAVAAAEVDDDAVLRRVWSQRFRAAPADEREKARQVRFLQSRGFGLSAILRFLRSAPRHDE